MLEEKIGGRFLREWKREDNRANIIIIHGVSEHCGRYIHVAEYFHEKGFNVYTGDLVGHGLSDGSRVFIKSIDDYIEDVNFFLKRVSDNKPVFILGHSLGGFIALYYGVKLHNPKVKGIILSSPYLKERLPISPLKLAFGRAVARLYPRFKIKSGIESYMVCRDTEVCSRYKEDKLNTDFVTAGWFVGVERARKYALEKLSDFNYPCLMLQAGEDIIVDSEANKDCFGRIPSIDKEYELYEDFYHEILNDPERETIMKRICDWIDERL